MKKTTNNTEKKILLQELNSELKNGILNFWINNTVDTEYGGFYGYIDVDMQIDKKANKAVVICSRILWTFSKAYNSLEQKEYLKMAQHAYDYLSSAFYDNKNGGVFWAVDYEGKVNDRKKMVYAQAFAIYGLTEYYMATSDLKALNLALELFHLLENKCKDKKYGGYYECLTEDWTALMGVSLGKKDLVVPKSMNTNLHVMEAYTNLLRVTSNKKVSQALVDLTEITIEKIVNPKTKQFMLYFDEEWNSVQSSVSFGHDIEGSWLLTEAAEVVGDDALIQRVKDVSVQMAEACYQLGLDKTTGYMSETVVNGISADHGTEWWTYAEAAVGFYNAYEITKDEKYYYAVKLVLNYIKSYIVDKKYGEWYWSVTKDGKTVLDRQKVSGWKCPYHNSRMCFELISRIGDDNMSKNVFEKRKNKVVEQYNRLVGKENKIDETWGNGIVDRYINPVVTSQHIPLEWRYDFDCKTNPYFLERIGVNAAFNSGAIYFDGKYVLVVRVEGADRKSYFAVARSENGIDNFVFDEYPVRLPVYDEPDTNVYDMRLTKHQDGWIYGLFCSERKDKTVDDTSSAVAKCGIVRTKNLADWERLPDLDTKYQQRNVVLHPEYVNGKYLLYTRPSDGFIDVGSGGGIGCAYVDDICNAKIEEEVIIEERIYHTIKESKNGAGATPIKTDEGWLHIAHGVRNTAAGLRYVIYCFMTDLNSPEKVIYAPGGYFMAPYNDERVGDVSNVLFCNGAIEKDGEIFIYYASSDTRLHVATTTVKKMIDYCKNTPKDGYTTHTSVDNIYSLINKNKKL